MAEVFRLSFVLGCEKKHKTRTHAMIRQDPEWKTAVTRTTPAQHQALDQAAAWIARLRANDVSAGDRARFACWLSEDAGNAAAFDRMLELWSDLGVLRALPIEIPRTARAWRWQLPLGLAAAPPRPPWRRCWSCRGVPSRRRWNCAPRWADSSSCGSPTAARSR
jgi:hypothetical protein